MHLKLYTLNQVILNSSQSPKSKYFPLLYYLLDTFQMSGILNLLFIPLRVGKHSAQLLV